MCHVLSCANKDIIIIKIDISDAGTPQPDRDFDAETLLIK